MDNLFPLSARREIAEGTMEFTFDTSGSDYQFRAGQHTDFTLIDPPYTDAEGNGRSFSFVNLPGQQKLVIATRMRDTAFKNSLKEIPLGTKVQAEDAHGRFFFDQDLSKPTVCLVGGIGITPFMSLINDSINRAERRQIWLFYANRNLAGTAYADELAQLAASQPEFHFVPTLTDAQPKGWTSETGRIDAAMLTKHCPEIKTAVIFSAGPPPMVKAMVELAESLGIEASQIRTEDFSGY